MCVFCLIKGQIALLQIFVLLLIKHHCALLVILILKQHAVCMCVWGVKVGGGGWITVLTVVGELHSLTDWQVSEASDDAELDDFC